jgi:light-regulated signal transduction histidine kinase (bacteriophytochrome)
MSNPVDPLQNPGPLSNSQCLASETLLRRIIYRIRQSLDLSVILATTAQEVQQFLGVDRVMIYSDST